MYVLDLKFKPGYKGFLKACGGPDKFDSAIDELCEFYAECPWLSFEKFELKEFLRDFFELMVPLILLNASVIHSFLVSLEVSVVLRFEFIEDALICFNFFKEALITHFIECVELLERFWLLVFEFSAAFGQKFAK